MLGWGLVLTLCLATMVALPLVNRGILPGKNVHVATVTLAVSELLQARYPYHVAVSEREPVTLLPGSLFLAVPFVWLHIAGLQSLVWIVFFYFALRKWSGDARLVPFFLLAILLGAPVIVHEPVSGSDYLGNCIWILLVIAMVANYGNLSAGQRAIFAVLTGVAFSSRLTFLEHQPSSFFLDSAILGVESSPEVWSHGSFRISGNYASILHG